MKESPGATLPLPEQSIVAALSLPVLVLAELGDRISFCDQSTCIDGVAAALCLLALCTGFEHAHSTVSCSLQASVPDLPPNPGPLQLAAAGG